MTVEKDAVPLVPGTVEPPAEVADAAALLARVRALRERSGGGRVVVGITGSPGAGKTTLALGAVRAAEPRLVDRHTRHGRTVEAATAWANEVDGRNALLVESTRPRADLVVSGAISFDVVPQARSTSA